MSFYNLEFNDSKGNKVQMKDFKGKVLLIVNTATKCGFTPQLTELEALHQKYKDKGLVVIGFPCNQFGGQEPETNANMASFCKVNYGVTFLLSEKIEVNGKSTHPVFEYLKNEARRGVLGKRIKWNFTKFLVSSVGKKIERYSPATSPSAIDGDILNLLIGNLEGALDIF